VESTQVVTSVLMSGFKADALLGTKEPRPERPLRRSFRPSDIMEASLNISNRNIPKGNLSEIRVYPPRAKTKKKG